MSSLIISSAPLTHFHRCSTAGALLHHTEDGRAAASLSKKASHVFRNGMQPHNLLFASMAGG